MRGDISRQFGGSAVQIAVPRYSSVDALKNPSRGYPDPVALYGMDIDPALSQHPFSGKRHDEGRNPEGTFLRGQNVPATLALEVIGAERVPNENIYMCTWDDSRDVLGAVFPFADDKHHFHIYALPERRTAHGPTFHGWAFGVRLARKAVGTSSNRAEGAVQPPLPPALRKVNYRELLMILEARNQVGLPCPINTDASL